jgi:hypothetical protein
VKVDLLKGRGEQQEGEDTAALDRERKTVVESILVRLLKVQKNMPRQGLLE